MKTQIKILLLTIFAFVGVSCTSIPVAALMPPTDNPVAGNYVQMMGDADYLRKPDGTISFKVRNAKSGEDVNRTISGGIMSWAFKSVAETMDNNDTKVETETINSSTKATSEANALDAAKEANRSKEALTELELSAPVPAPAP